MAEIMIDAKCPKLPPRPYFHYIRENVSHRSYEATCCFRFAVLEAHWVKVNSIVLAFRYPSSLRSKTKKSKVSQITLLFAAIADAPPSYQSTPAVDYRVKSYKAATGFKSCTTMHTACSWSIHCSPSRTMSTTTKLHGSFHPCHPVLLLAPGDRGSHQDNGSMQ